VNIDVEKANPLAARGEAQGEIHRDRAFSHAAFAGKNHECPANPA
jgi:hypothetical protein